MLSDLLQLEVYYGTPEAAQFFEDLSRHYGPAMVRKALRAGEITGRPFIAVPTAAAGCSG